MKRAVLLLIFLIAVFLRFWQLGSNPPALTWDEASWGYNAYSFGLTGQDEFGRSWPFDYLESFGDFKPPIYAYLSILPVKVFGLNAFAVRFASAFFGSLTVLLTYFLAKEIFPKITNLPLIASFLLAISPWHIMLSRVAFEANVATFFVVAGVVCFLISLRFKPWFLILSAISFSLSLHTFNTARVVVPLLVLILAIVFRKKLWQKKVWVIVAGIVGLLIIAPAVSFFLSPQAKLRYKEVNIFSDPGVVLLANQEVVNDGGTGWAKIIHNRRWGYARSYLRHYFDHFNLDFLFFKGDGNPKFSTQDTGQLYLWELPFLVAGTLFLIKKKPGFWWLVFAWLLVGIVPAATARETPHALRIETTLPTWQIISALGIVSFFEWIKKQKRFTKNVSLFVFGGSVLINFIYFQHGYWQHYPKEFSGEWQYGYQEAIEFIKEVETDYGQIWFTNQLGRPYIYFLYYLQIHPNDFQKQAVTERDVFGFVKINRIGKYHFFKSEETPQSSGKALIINGVDRIPGDVNVLETFYLLNDKLILKAYETNKI